MNRWVIVLILACAAQLAAAQNDSLYLKNWMKPRQERQVKKSHVIRVFLKDVVDEDSLVVKEELTGVLSEAHDHSLVLHVRARTKHTLLQEGDTKTTTDLYADHLNEKVRINFDDIRMIGIMKKDRGGLVLGGLGGVIGVAGAVAFFGSPFFSVVGSGGKLDQSLYSTLILGGLGGIVLGSILIMEADNDWHFYLVQQTRSDKTTRNQFYLQDHK